MKKASNFTLPNQDGKIVSLSDFPGKWIVLYFYPKDDTPGCTMEGQDFSRLQKEFEQKKCIILGISPDSEKSHCRFREKHHLSIQLLSDVEKKTIQEYGAWGEKKFMGRTFKGVIRSTFLINPEGFIAKFWSPVNVKGHAEEVLKTVD